jgi:acetylornithine/N-succinyldiaminopimelate aminotransferase
MTLAKGLGNGVPIGACLARGHAAELFKPGSHGSTFGGGPLACAAAHAVLDTIEGEGLCQHAAKTGALLLERLKRGLANLDGIGDIRGQGMMIAIELTHECANLVAEALGKGLLINVTSGSVIRLLPPLILDEQQAEQLASRLIELVKEHLAKRRDENAA